MEAKESKFTSKMYRALGPTGGAVLVFILEVLQIVIISLAIIIPVRVFLIQPFLVQGASMEPTFHDHEYLIIDEITYRFSEPQRGDIIVFRPPNNERERYIKRIVGLPGETVEVSDGVVTIINDEHPVGRVIEETYLDEGVGTVGKKRVKLNPDEYFVLGDNRNFSLDSRSFGPVKEDRLIGKVWLRGFPLSRFGSFDLPEYNL